MCSAFWLDFYSFITLFIHYIKLRYIPAGLSIAKTAYNWIFKFNIAIFYIGWNVFELSEERAHFSTLKLFNLLYWFYKNYLQNRFTVFYLFRQTVNILIHAFSKIAANANSGLHTTDPPSYKKKFNWSPIIYGGHFPLLTFRIFAIGALSLSIPKQTFLFVYLNTYLMPSFYDVMFVSLIRIWYFRHQISER